MSTNQVSRKCFAHVRSCSSPSLVNLHFQFLAIMVLLLYLFSIFLLCVNLIELVQICSVLTSWILSVSISRFYVSCCIIKLILGPVNFVTELASAYYVPRLGIIVCAN
jgi:hypothetical protein